MPHPINQRIKQYLQDADQKKNDSDYAQSLDRLIEQNPRDTLHYLCRGYLARRKGDIQAALRDFKTAKLLAPNDELTHHSLAYTFIIAGYKGKAIRCCRESMRVFPNSSIPYRLLAELESDRNIALTYCDSAIAKDQSDDVSQRIRGVLLHKAQRHSDAEAGFLSALQHNPQNAIAYANYAQLLITMKREQEIPVIYAKALTQIIDPYNRGLLTSNFVAIYMDQADYPKALAAINALIAANPTDYHNYMKRAALHQQISYSRQVASIAEGTIQLSARERTSSPIAAPPPATESPSALRRWIKEKSGPVVRFYTSCKQYTQSFMARHPLPRTRFNLQSPAVRIIAGIGLGLGLIAAGATVAAMVEPFLGTVVIAAGVMSCAGAVAVWRESQTARLEANRQQPINAANVRNARAKTTPEILAAITVYHSDCSDKHKLTFKRICHELYSIPENRAIMDVAAWKALHGERPLQINATTVENKERFWGKKPILGTASHTGIVQTTIDLSNRGTSAAVLIHELAHSVVGEVEQNEMKVYARHNPEAKKQYHATVKSSEASESLHLTHHEQFVVGAMLSPHTMTSVYNSRAWKKERLVRLPQLATIIGKETVERLYPEESNHLNTFLQKCRRFLQQKNYSVAMEEVINVNNTRTEDNSAPPIDLASIANAVVSRAQYKALGTNRKSVNGNIGRVTERIFTMLCDAKITNAHVTTASPEGLQTFVDQCADICMVAFQRHRLRQDSVDISRIDTARLRGCIEAKASVLHKMTHLPSANSTRNPLREASLLARQSAPIQRER